MARKDKGARPALDEKCGGGKRSRLKRVLIILVVLVVVGSCANAMSGGNKESGSSDTSTASQEDSSAQTSDEKSSEAAGGQSQEEGTAAEEPAGTGLSADQQSGDESIDKFVAAYNAVSQGPVGSVSYSKPMATTTSYGAKMEITHANTAPSRLIISIYSNGEDTSAMRSAFVDAVLANGSAMSAEDAGALFDQNYAGEAGLDTVDGIERVIFSAPNGIEDFYRVDIYTNKFE